MSLIRKIKSTLQPCSSGRVEICLGRNTENEQIEALTLGSEASLQLSLDNLIVTNYLARDNAYIETIFL